MSRHPLTKWAQRSDKVYITIELPDAKEVKLSLQPNGQFHFSATTGAENVPYEIDFELYDKVNVEESKAAVGLRNICYLVKKAESKWWSRLLKKEGRPPAFLKVDWDKWIDEDEEHGNKFDDEFGGMDFSKLDMGGADDDFDLDGAKDGDDDEMDENKAEDAAGEATTSAHDSEAKP
ncbi:co-chaperone protein p23-1-like [Dioscorea cayenensis subsp. rotundata]|uniref:Co-chaperone protein p23 n=1 Tax=Dioscorea cayennensis subsp. rotundata TaxID=55577 RepID=A0AB40D1E1_DIOCR|nr:co-chaperone protein p23-1-like [Dioscorea cayenensis subsp. rotundata]